MANLDDELNKATEEFKEIFNKLKSKEAFKELQEIKEAGRDNLEELKQIKNDAADRIKESAVYDDANTNRHLLSLQSLFSSSGRLGKAGYLLINIVIYTLLVLLTYLLIYIDIATGMFRVMELLLIVIMAMFWLVYSFTLVRRLHDCGKNGLPVMLLIPFLVMCHSIGSSRIYENWHFVPFFAGIAIAIIAASMRGTEGDNSYGPVPPDVTLRNIVSFDIDVKELFNRYKKRFATIFCIVAIVGGIGTYLYIPKVSDVEKYYANRDIDKLTKLVDDTTKQKMFLDVRAEGIRALISLNDPEADWYIFNKLLLEKAHGNKYSNKELRDEILLCGASVDDKFMINLIDKFLRYNKKQPYFGKFDKIHRSVYDDMLYLVSLTNDKSTEKYVVGSIVLDCMEFILKEDFRDIDKVSYLQNHIEKHFVKFDDIPLAINLSKYLKRYCDLKRESLPLKEEYKKLKKERQKLLGTKAIALEGRVKRYDGSYWFHLAHFNRKINLDDVEDVESKYPLDAFCGLPVEQYWGYVKKYYPGLDDRVNEIDKHIEQINEEVSKVDKYLDDVVKPSMNKFRRSLLSR